jgi:PRA1 family protein
MSRMTANIPAGTQEYISVTSQQLFSRQKLRSITIVFGIGEERPFYLEKMPTLLIARLKHNFQFFFLNYLVVTGVLFFLTMLTSPRTLIGLGLLAAVWMYVVRQTQSGSMSVYGKSFCESIQVDIDNVVIRFHSPMKPGA